MHCGSKVAWHAEVDWLAHQSRPTVYEFGAQATTPVVRQHIASCGFSGTPVGFDALPRRLTLCEFCVQVDTTGGQHIACLVDPGLPGTLVCVAMSVSVVR